MSVNESTGDTHSGDNPPVGYRGPTACAAAAVTYRQLDYWTRIGLVTPSVRAASGSGTQRLYSRDDIVRLATVRLMLRAGFASLSQMRDMFDVLFHVGHWDLNAGDWPALRVTLDVNAIARHVDTLLEGIPTETGTSVFTPAALRLIP